MLKKLVIGSVIAVGVLSFGFAAHASLLGNDTVGDIVKGTTQSVTDTVSKTTEIANPVTKSLCETITPKVDGKISDFNQKFNKHLSYYKDQRGKLQILVDQLEDKGVDTAKLRADLVLFDLKQKKFEDDKDPVLTQLGLIKEDKCANHLISASSDLASAVTAEKNLLTDSKDLLAFLDTNIQNDIEGLRK